MTSHATGGDALTRIDAPLEPGRSRAPASRGIVARRHPRLAGKLALASMLAPMAAGLLIFFAYPLVESIYLSFTSFNLLSPPVWIGLRNYQYLFTSDPNIVAASLNTLWFVIVLVPVRVVCALAIAGLLARPRPGAGIWRTIFYLPALVPPVASVVAFVFLFNPSTGPVNTILRSLGIDGPLWFNDPALAKPSLVILGVWMMGDVMVIFLAALLDVPKEYYEAAELDGANAAQRTWHITLPTMAPVLGFAAVTGVIAALQYFTEAAVASGVASGKATIGGGAHDSLGYPDNSLLTYTEWLYDRGFGSYQLGYASALAVVLFVVSAVLLLVAIRRIRVFNGKDLS
jgi:multiple sugar transport system permease protein